MKPLTIRDFTVALYTSSVKQPDLYTLPSETVFYMSYKNLSLHGYTGLWVTEDILDMEVTVFLSKHTLGIVNSTGSPRVIDFIQVLTNSIKDDSYE